MRPVAQRCSGTPDSTAAFHDRALKRGETLVIGDATLRFGTLTALAGSTIRLAHPNAHLIVTNLAIEPGATFEWIAGTIEIDAGAWLHPYDLAIGCEGDARLVLASGAFVRAPALRVCERGALVGDGAVDAPTTNGGAIAGDGAGLRILGPYAQEAAGVIVASIDELDAVVAGGVHDCSRVDLLPSTVGLAPSQFVDVDGDGDLDLVRSVDVGGESIVAVWLNAGSNGADGTYGCPVVCTMSGGAWTTQVFDVDDDGVLDVVAECGDGRGSCTLMSGGRVEVRR